MQHAGQTDTNQPIGGVQGFKDEKVQNYDTILAKIVPGFKGKGNIKTGLELANLIDETEKYNKQTKKQIFELITPIEIIQLISDSHNQFLLRVAQKLSYKCLEFLKKANIGYLVIQSRLKKEPKIAEEFVISLNQSNRSVEEKENILSILLYFNEEVVTKVVQNAGNNDTINILNKLKQQAETIEKFLDKSGKLIYSTEILTLRF